MDYHTLPVSEIYRELSTSERGISEKEVSARLKKFGPNKLKEIKKRTALKIFLEQFKSFLVLLLIFATIVSAAIGNFLDAGAIAAILILNALLGFWQEYKAEAAIEAIKKFAAPRARVIRGGKPEEIPTEELVPGDFVLLEEGERVPADIRLAECFSLKIDESALTGESIAVEKNPEVSKAKLITEQKNMAFLGTAISFGHGSGIVVRTGMETEIGKNAKLVQEEKEETPLQKKLEKFGKKLGYFVLAIAAVIFAIGFFEGAEISELALTAIALAVAVVPEGLPAIVTITLAVGVQMMSKQKAIVRKLSAIEGLGSVNVICADKTGTMTTNEMTVRKIFAGKEYEVSGAGFVPEGKFLLNKKEIAPAKVPELNLLLRISELCNNSRLVKNEEWKIFGDPTEGALKVLSAKAELKISTKRENEIPFSSDRKMMSTIDRFSGRLYVHTKGAPEILLAKCEKILDGDSIRTLTTADRKKILQITETYARAGMRTLAFAYKEIQKFDAKSAEEKLIFVGIVGMIDPPRPEVKESVRIAHEAGIRVVMITGDHAETAKAIGAEVGIVDSVLTGEELEKLNERELEKIVDRVSIYARVSPLHKVKILEALKKRGNIVAMTGDGVNDAPAIKKADIGIAMGKKGTDVAREVSDIVLADDNFASIVSAVDEGRGIYDNIKKFVRFLLAVNFAEIFFVAAAMLLRLPLPLLPLQILWMNLITDGPPALALAVDPKDKEIMKRKPRPAGEEILSGEHKFLVASGIVALLAAMVAYVTELPLGLEKARTVAFTTIVFFELFFVFNCREIKPIWKTNIFGNKKLLWAVAISIILQLLVIYTPAGQQIFDTVALSAGDWGKIVLLSAAGFAVVPSWFIKTEKLSQK